MSLNKQLVHLNMTGGLQKKDDQFLVIPSKLAVADNVEFDDASSVISRGGQASVSLTTAPLATLAVRRAERLFTHKGRCLVESRGDALPGLGGGVHRVNSAGGTAIVANPNQLSSFLGPYRFRRAGMVTERVTSIDRKGTAYGSGVPFYDGSYDFALVDGYRYYAVETRDTTGTGRQSIKYTIINDSTGFTVLEGLITDSTNVLVKPRIIAVTGKTAYLYFASFASGGTSFSVKVVSLSSSGVGSVNTVLTTASTGGTIEGTSNDAALFDAAYSDNGTKIGLAVRDATAAGTTILFRELSTSNGYTISSSNTATASARITTLTALVSFDGVNYRTHAFYGIGNTTARSIAHNMTAGTVTAENTVGTAPAGTTGRMVAVEATQGNLLLAYDVITSAGVSSMRLSGFTSAYGTLVECASSGPWVLAGRIATAQSRLYAPMAFLSNNFQSTYYVVDLSDAFANLNVAGNSGPPWQVLARIDYGEGALDTNRWQLTTRVPNFQVNGDELDFAYLKYETDLRLAGTTIETPYALHRANIDLASQLEHVEINNLTFLSGACPYVFDGSNMVEEGFHHGPELSTSAALTTTGYQLPNASASYTVCFTLAWQDAAGNWWESAPSNERTFAVTGGSGNYFIPTTALVVPPTQKANYMILMYRTPALGTNTSLYLASKMDGTFITSDTDLDDGEQLYTAGNVLPNTPAPACRHVSVFQKRLVLSGCGDGSRIYWSKQTTPGYGVEFNSGDPTHQTQVPSDKGRAVATKEMDDRLVILCENGVGLIGGQGPDPTGTSGQYSDFSSIITETGCSWDSPKSVIRGPEGVWFRSPFGLRLVSRSGSLARAQDGKQVGAEVDSLVSGTVVAIAGDAKQQIRFYQSSGTVLVWDYQWQQWTRFTGFANVDACYADDRYYHLSNYSTSSPLLRYTSDSVYLDVDDTNTSSSYFQMVLETPWLSFAGIQGFQRVYRLMILGRSTGVQTYGVALDTYTNFSATAAESVSGTFAPAAAGNKQFQMQHHFSTQKCESMKLKLTIDPDSVAVDGRLRITDLTLQVGVKGGYFKLPSSQRF